MRSKRLSAGIWIGATALAAMGAMAVASLGHRGTVYDRSAVKDPAARDVANLVDRVVQDRFRRPLDRTFGISRIARPEDARMIHSRSTVDADRPLLAKAEASERAWRVLYYPTRSLKEDSLKVRDFPHGPGLTPVASSKRPAKGVVSAAFLAGAAAILKEHEPFLNGGRSLEASVEDWRALLSRAWRHLFPEVVHSKEQPHGAGGEK